MGEGEEADILGQLGRCVQTEGGGWVGDQRYSEVQLCPPSQVEMAIVSEEKGRWKDLLVSKYRMNFDRSLGPVKFQSWWWRDLQKVCTEGEGGGWFHNQLVWKVGGGEKVNFWEDVWIGNMNLKSLFPSLFSLSLDQGLMVSEVGEWVGAAWRWNLRWRRDRFEWETPLETNLVQLLSRVSLLRDQKDVQTWGCDGSGSFSVHSAYECLVKEIRSPHQEVFEYLWRIKAFPNTITTAWRVLLGRIPTRVGLRRRGVLLNTILCELCQAKEESCHHIFLECPFAMKVWTLCFKWIGISFVQHNVPLMHFENFCLPQVSNKQNLLWKGVWACVVRSIWEHRNSVVFKQGVVDAEETFLMAQLKSWQWLKHKGNRCSYSWLIGS